MEVHPLPFDGCGECRVKAGGLQKNISFSDKSVDIWLAICYYNIRKEVRHGEKET